MEFEVCDIVDELFKEEYIFIKDYDDVIFFCKKYNRFNWFLNVLEKKKFYLVFFKILLNNYCLVFYKLNLDIYLFCFLCK